jgi:prepilin-type N-terminal cleavage/methylation domain-containing protein
MNPTFGRRSHERGFSLIELIMAFVVVAVGAALAVSALNPASRSIDTDIDLQVVNRLAQACFEHIIMVKNTPVVGFASLVTAGAGICASLTTVAGYALSVTLVATVSAPCPGVAAAQCQDMRINVVPTGSTTITYQFMMINF